MLQGADGVVFVADSQPDRLTENIDTWKNLQKNLHDLGQNSATFPVIFQFNKRDAPNALSLDTLRAALNCNGHQQFEAVAVKGIGVYETLRPAIKTVMNNIMKRL